MHQLSKNTFLQGGKYKIEKVLGQGGFGITYLATQELLDRKVCIKEFFFKDSCSRTLTGEVELGAIGNRDLVERFLNKFIKEARTLSQLDHSNIIRVLDIFKENNTAYYVMDYIEGTSLEDVVNSKGSLSEDIAIDYIKQIANALEYIHQRSINHLDVKPANIMIRRNDNKAILIDFGVSKQYDSQGEQTSTTPVGISYGYAPIEQYRPGGVSEFSPQADIYALGATLYKMVTGKIPPQAIEVFNEGFLKFPHSLSSNLDSAIQKAMQPKRGDRPQSVIDFLKLVDNNTYQNSSSYSSNYVSINEATVIIESNRMKNEINGHEYVDLGLPSGLKWATCNIGANKPEEYGDYYAWGEVRTKQEYREDNYDHNIIKNGFFGIKKVYNNLGTNISESQYDVARTRWGSSWRIPTITEWEELKNKCVWTWVPIGGRSGCKITGPNGNNIFLPDAGCRFGSSFLGGYGHYWSSLPHTNYNDYAFDFELSYAQDYYKVGKSSRWYGLTVRPVTN